MVTMNATSDRTLNPEHLSWRRRPPKASSFRRRWPAAAPALWSGGSVRRAGAELIMFW